MASSCCTSSRRFHHLHASGRAPPLAGVSTAAALYPTTYLIGLLAMDADPVAGVAAVEFGLRYAPAAGAGVDVFSWQLCGDTEATVDEPTAPGPRPVPAT